MQLQADERTPKQKFMHAVQQTVRPEIGSENLIWEDKVALRFIEEGYKMTVKKDDAVIIQHIAADKTGKGHGSECLSMLTSFADKAGVTLYVLPDKDELYDWYQKFKFERLDGENEDPEAMRRLPSNG